MLVSQGAQACPSTGETGAFYVTDFCAAAP
jgi:hypothetical protein